MDKTKIVTKPETKIIPGGMKAAMARFRELYGSYEQHLKMKQSKDGGIK